MKKMKMAS